MSVPAIEPAATRQTVMVIEDNVELRFLVSDVLRTEGYRVVEAATTDEALAFLKTSNGVSLVFADIVVPGPMDGLEFARMLERDHPYIKVILTSGKVPRDAVPANMHLMKKPYILARVVQEVGKALGLEPG